MGKRRPVLERFWEKVEDDPETGCWNWTAAIQGHGYGSFAVSHDQIVRAHRFAYEHMVAAIPDGLEIDHLCRNRACVNPYHMEPVTHTENVRRGDAGHATVRAYRARPYVRRTYAKSTHCRNGHEWNEESTGTYAKGRYCLLCSRLRAARKRARRKLAN